MPSERETSRQRRRRALPPRQADAPFTGSSSGSIRRRALRACVPCRRRKKKCDGSYPCITCRQFEYDCAYDSPETHASSETAGTDEREWTSAEPELVLNDHHVQGEKRKNEEEASEPNKLRFFDGGSSAAFPRALAWALHSETAPRLNSFAYNVGLRPERVFRPEKIIMYYLPFDEARHYLQNFKAAIHLHFALVPENMLEHLADCYQPDKFEDETNMMLEVTLCFVVALGSFYSWPESSSRESELVQAAERVLDRATYNETTPSLVRLNVARAWMLRTMYARTTTRPNIAWLCSSTTLHVCENLGLHKEVESLRVMAPNLAECTPVQLEMRRRMFWCAWAVNRLESFNLGRSCTPITNIDVKYPNKADGDDTGNLLGIARALHRFTDEPLDMSPDECLLTLEEVAPENPGDSPVLSLVRTEVACSLYRRLRASDRNLAQQSVERLINVGRKGLEGARHYLEIGKPWFKLVSTPFQFACTVISIGDLKVLDCVGEALNILYAIQAKFQTPLAKEAYETARLLAQIASQAREKELAVLRRALGEPTPPPEPWLPEFTQDDFDWAAFFNKDYFDLFGSAV